MAGNAAMMNPMMNPVVLETFFKVCDISDLRRFRQVCHQWYDLSLPRFRKDMRVIIMLADLIPAELSKLDWKDVPQLFENEEDWRKFKTHPFQKYFLCHILFDHRDCSATPICIQGSGITSINRYDAKVSTNSAVMEKFWKICGPSMRSLILEICRVECIKSLKQVIFERTPNLEWLTFRNEVEWDREMDRTGCRGSDEVKIQPNLIWLDIDVYEETRSPFCLAFSRPPRRISKPWFPIPWKVLFEHFPNVYTLDLVEVSVEGALLGLVEALEEMAKSEDHKLTIKRLNIYDVLNKDTELVKRLLSLKQMKLEALLFPASLCEDSSMTVLPYAFQLHGDTLQTLLLKREGFMDFIQPYAQFPFTSGMTSLTNLQLEKDVIPNLHFLRQTPNLKLLRICQADKDLIIKNTDESLLENVVLANLIEFLFYFERPNNLCFSEKKMKLLVKVMPNLKRLRAPLSAGALRVVCQNWKELNRMDTFNGKLKDVDVTGILPGQEERTEVSLVDLKYLCVLSIRSATLTDSSVYKGFLQMPHLHTLEVTLSKETSDTAFSALFYKFPGTKISRRLSSSGRSVEENEVMRLKKLKNVELDEIAKKWKRDFVFP